MRKSSIIILLFSLPALASGQSLTNQLEPLHRKASHLFLVLQKNASLYLQQAEAIEHKLARQLQKADPDAAQSLLQESRIFYRRLQEKLAAANDSMALNGCNDYLPGIDSLRVALKLSQAIDCNTSKIAQAEQQLDRLQSLSSCAQSLFMTLYERQLMLQQRFPKLFNCRILSKYIQLAQGYRDQLRHWQTLVSSPALWPQKAFELARTTPVFARSFAKYSRISALIYTPSADGDTNLFGLQPKRQVEQLIQAHKPQNQDSHSPAILPAQLNAIAGQLHTGQTNASAPGIPVSGSPQRRWDFGSSFQNAGGTPFLPATTQCSVTGSHRLFSGCRAGIGINYTVGWGRLPQKLAVSSQGIGFHAFFQYQCPRNFYAIADAATNYQQPFQEIQVLYHFPGWLRSGFIGLGKTVPIHSSLFRGAGVELLWDLFAATQLPRQSPFKCRVTYSW